MAQIEGLDMSHWQGRLSLEDAEKMVDKGIKFVGVKFSQGTGYKDDVAEHNTTILQSVGILVFPYHFMTPENALSQYNWFVSCMGNMQFDLPPAMDCEYYRANQRGEVPVVMELRYARPPLMARVGAAVGAYAITTEAIVDSMGMKLAAWMKLQPKLRDYEYPEIYTNVHSGNAIFKSAKMSRYPLWVANWRVSTPYLPKVWAGKKYILWQDNVIPGAPYGINGDVDHDVWGTLFQFPTDVTPPPPPPPAEKYFDVVAKSKSGKSYKGRVVEEK